MKLANQEEVFVSYAIKNKDERAVGPEFKAAKIKELKGLIERGTFKVVLKKKIAADTKLLKGSFVIVIKNKEADKEVYQARLVIQGFDDPMKKELEHNSSNLRQESARLLLTMASIMGFAYGLSISAQLICNQALTICDTYF
eukprot:Plantae.Rhodophyta-Palmaria_palmata.ctg3092.p1 GENE.Plantae.Rhodophyta-Palmaria_palmata.ctg3092~~Plantae.Rhodophyta-Palmaria_palmata.ctg3092.p1  ORF type:complete len:142 (+),score=21.95 Plantae.Rhodophyta-Palmaria_palmata.ctg3092:36-461(+)